ncbi:hypothetical protein MMC27_003794 [Xylographa pallens]|nr:hypothetical protein [Xylographa pallens]
MRYDILLLGSLMPFVKATVIPTIPAGYPGSVPIYESTDVVTGKIIQLYQKGSTGTTQYSSVNSSSYTPRITYKPVTNSTFSDDIVIDVCLAIADCAGSAYESSAAQIAAVKVASATWCNSVAGSVNDFLTNNNYAETYPILTGQILSFVVQIASTVPIYYINAKLDLLTGKDNPTSDACGETQPKAYAGNAADAIFEFCLAIQSVEQEKMAKRFLMADVSSGGAESASGKIGIAQFFISSTEEFFGPTCSDFGITWKRSLADIVRSLWYCGLWLVSSAS